MPRKMPTALKSVRTAKTVARGRRSQVTNDELAVKVQSLSADIHRIWLAAKETGKVVDKVLREFLTWPKQVRSGPVSQYANPALWTENQG